jgi:signal transduction histidine kinase
MVVRFFVSGIATTITANSEHLHVGSSVRVSGGCWASDNVDANFDIYAETATVAFSIPAQSVTSESPAQPGSSGAEFTPATAPTVLDILRPILLTLLLIFLGTLIYLVNRRLREQEKFQESIHEQLSHLSHIARLNTLAEMVGALAHELNQPLASVSNYAATAELLSRKEPTDSKKLAGVLTNIGQEAFRAGEIIRRLRHLVRRKTPGSLPVHVSEIILETVELFKTQHVTASGLVQVDVPDDLPAVQADSVQIQQVVLNLLLNARDATEAQSDRTSAIQVETSSENGMVCVSVSDNGIGISSKTPDAIFEPYFTTREKGTGLGLAISRTIIETHGGKITSENGSPFGTRITFSLPVSRSSAKITS